MDLDSQICYCFHIKKRKIVIFVKQTRPKRASQISECFGAGTGCGWCIPFLRRIHHQIVAGDIVESDDISPAEYEALRASYRQEIRDGTPARTTHDTAVVPPELEESVAPAIERRLAAILLEIHGQNEHQHDKADREFQGLPAQRNEERCSRKCADHSAYQDPADTR